MQSPGGEERREDRRDGRYFFSQAARATGYCTECAAEETNNPSFINSRLKHRRKKGQKNIPNYIFWSLCFFLTVLTQLICFFLNTTPSLHTHTLKKNKKKQTSIITLHLARLSRSNRQYKKLFALQGANATLSSILLPSM